VLRVCFGGIKDCELKDAYEESFLSELHPGVALSRNTVSAFLAFDTVEIPKMIIGNSLV
jgi:hypothetical protein